MASPRADEFVTQAREHLAALEGVLLALEETAGADARREAVDRSFRIVHSIKGDAGFLGFRTIRALANGMETVLETLRGGDPAVAPGVVETLLMARDKLANLVDDLEGSAQADIGDLLAQLDRAERGLSGTGAGAGPETETEAAWDVDLSAVGTAGLAAFFRGFGSAGEVTAVAIELGTSDLAAGPPIGPVRFRARLRSSTPPEEVAAALGLPADAFRPLAEPGPGLDLTIPLAGWPAADARGLAAALAELAALGPFDDARLTPASDDLAAGVPRGPLTLAGRLRTDLPRDEVEGRLGLRVDAPAPAPVPVAAAAPPPAPRPAAVPPTPAEPPEPPAPPAAAEPGRPAGGGEPDRTASLRINVELLDRLMTLTSELTLIRNQSLLAFHPDDGVLRPIVQRLDAVTSALQETVLRTRMQPVGNLFGKFPRVVRDLGRQLGKQVEVAIQGRDVELDKTILEQLSDPLTHLVRNSVDHGVETPEARVARGKPAVGRITLSAAHEDGQIRIEIRDDGKGIDPAAVREKALAMRLKTEAELDRMSPRELFGLILLPGFSTARSVTEVSGRGVGMDVVKTNIETLEGSLTIDSHPGLGTSMILRMPLTLAIIPCLIVTVGGERYAIPQRELEEAVCLHPGLKGRIERAYDTEVFRLRDRLLPIVRMGDILANPEPFDAATRARLMAGRAAAVDEPAGVAYILVLRTAGRRFGLVVDEVKGTEEIVVKPMHGSIKRVGIFTGATIMGDGKVALIADVAGIAEHARLSLEAIAEAAPDAGSAKETAQPHRVLLFENGPRERFALPLLQIRRIEMVSRDRIGRVGEHEYVTLDGLSMRVLRLEKVLDVSAPEPPPDDADPAAPVALILPKFVAEPVAIYVTRIVDTESLSVELQGHPEQDQGILGSTIVRGRMTLFLDLHRLTLRLFGRPLPGSAPPASPGRAGAPRPSGPKRLLLIDDTPFFREVVKRYLTAEGHEVETANHGVEGLAVLESRPAFDLIISDIEMPVMDGWEFAREARRRGVATPILALTSLSGVANEIKARDCGFDSYEVKLDHDRLIRKVEHLLAATEALA